MVTPYRAVNIFILEACVLILQIYAPLIVRHKFPLAMYAFNLNDVPIEITNKTVVRAVRGRVLFVMAIDLCNRVAALAQKDQLYVIYERANIPHRLFFTPFSEELALAKYNTPLSSPTVLHLLNSFIFLCKFHRPSALIRLLRVYSETSLPQDSRKKNLTVY